jgi:hypothetical protein
MHNDIKELLAKAEGEGYPDSIITALTKLSKEVSSYEKETGIAEQEDAEEAEEEGTTDETNAVQEDIDSSDDSAGQDENEIPDYTNMNSDDMKKDMKKKGIIITIDHK